MPHRNKRFTIPTDCGVNKMRVVILVRILWTAGAPKIAIHEARTLQEDGHEVTLVFLRSSNLKGYGDLLAGLNCIVVSEDGSSAFTPIYDRVTRLFAPDRGSESRVDYNLLRRFPDIAKELHADLIICHDQWAGIAGYFSKRKYGIPYRVFLHEQIRDFEIPILGMAAEVAERLVIMNANRVFAITEKVAATARTHYPAPITTNWPGMDRLRWESFENKERSLIACAFWDIGRRPTAYLPIISAIDGFHLYFVGNWRIPSLREEMIREIAREGLTGRVSIVTHLTEGELMNMYDRVMFSLRFGFGEYGLGTATVESIQKGVPLIVNSDLGASRLVSTHRCGLVVDKIEPSQILEFIRASSNSQEYDRLRQGLATLTGKYTWASHARELVR